METNNDQSSGQKQELTALPPVRSAPSTEINLIDLMIVLARRKKLVIGLPMLVAALSVAISLALPNVYTATVKLLPPQQAQSGASALLAQLGGAAGGLAAGIAGVKSPGDLYIGMLKSRTVADKLVNRFDLKKRYDIASQEKARQRLAGRTAFVSGKDGMISVEVEDKDQKFVATLANGYIDELQLLTRTLAVTEASQRRMFYERELVTAKNNLAKGEMSLKGAMNSGGVISVDSESRAILETAARLKAQISAKEIQLGSMRAFVTAANPEFQRANEELGSLRAELAKLEGGRAGPVQPSASLQAGLDNIQLIRDVKYYQMLYELLAKQYEVARLDEAKEPSLIQVLDPAVEPERKSKPQRALIVLGATMMAFFAAIAWAFMSAAKQRAMTVPSEAARWNELRSHLRFR